MAVPPAHDGELTSDPADPESQDDPEKTDPPRATGPSRAVLIGLSAVLAVVIVVCLVVLGLRYARDTDPDDGVATRAVAVVSSGDAAEVQAEREAVMRQARQFVLRVNTYGPDDLEGQQMPGYVSRVEELITPKFAVDFEESSQLAAQPVAQAGYARSSEVGLVGVRDLGDNAATVMISGRFISSYPATEEGQPRQETLPVPLRLLISLVRTGGEWLVDDFVPVTGEQEEGDGSATTPADPTDPTDPTAPATPTTPAPTQGNGSGDGQGADR